jgi:hypothetical protein
VVGRGACSCATPAEGGTQLAEDATDRGQEPGERPLSFGMLVELAAVIAALDGVVARGAQR